jgi:hypothetical protein
MTAVTRFDPATTDSDALLGYLHASPVWVHTLSIEGEYPQAHFRYTQSPFMGYALIVPKHDGDPEGCARLAEVINGIESGVMPHAGLDPEAINRALNAIKAICQEGVLPRTAIGELMSVLHPWYRPGQARGAILRLAGHRQLPLPESDIASLTEWAAHLASLAAVERADGRLSKICTVPTDRLVDGHGIQRIHVTTPDGHTRQVVYPGTPAQALAYIQRQASTTDLDDDLEAALNALAATLTN